MGNLLRSRRQDRRGEFQHALQQSYSSVADNNSGSLADYIAVLAQNDPELCGACVVSIGGEKSLVGDYDYPHSIQSESKPIALAAAIEAHGTDAIVQSVGVEASGQPFNSVIAIEQLPAQNPCNNSGAIQTTSLLPGNSKERKWQSFANQFRKMTGTKANVMSEVYESESATNQRNRAITYLLESKGRMYHDPDETLDIYTRQCSVEVTSVELAICAATLANDGINPITGERAISSENVSPILSIMATSGLYDSSAVWLVRSGMPAKSGVGGSIMAVSPGRFGICAFSPLLDANFNSVRAQQLIIDFSRQVGGSVFN